MSLKDNLDYVKTELTAQEKFIENFVRAEKVFKKYKTLIIGTLIGIFVLIVGVITLDYLEEQNKISANIAFNQFLSNPSDEVALAVLKSKSKTLYEIAMYIKDSNHIPQVGVFKEIAIFQNAIKNNDQNAINSIISNGNFLLQEYAIVYKALQEAKIDDFESAKQTLKMLPQNSLGQDLIQLLEHYISTKSN